MEEDHTEEGGGDGDRLRPADEGNRSRVGSSANSDMSLEDDPDWAHLETCSNTSFSDASDGIDDEDGTDPTKEQPKVLLKPKPKHKWFVVKEIIERERDGGNMFKERYYGSLHVVQRLELMYKMEDHCGCVNAIHFNPSGTRLISGSDDRHVVIWDWVLGKSLVRFPTGHSSNVFHCKYLGSDYQIVTCSRDGQVRLAVSNGCNGFETKQVAVHSQPCHKLTTTPQSQHVFLSAGEDALVISVDVREPKPNKLMFVKENGKKISLYSIHCNPQSGNEICIAGEDHYVRIYDRRKISKDGIAHFKYAPHNVKANSMYYVTCAVFNYNGKEVLGSYNDDDIYLFDTRQPPGSDYVHRYEGHHNSQTVKGVNFFGPNSEFIVSGSDCGNIYFWDKETEAIVQFMRGDEDGVINCLEPHPHIPILATSGLDSDVKIWIPSCEHDPQMKGLRKTLKMNQVNRKMRFDNTTSTLNDTLLRLWSQISRNSYARRVELPSEILSRPLLVGSLFDTSTTSSDSSSSISDNDQDLLPT